MAKIGVKSYTESLNQAKELDNIAREISSLRTQIATMRNNSETEWTGKSANACRSALLADEKRLQKLEENVKNNARAIRAVIKDLQEAQELNARAAKKVNG